MKRQRLLNTLLLAACLMCAITASAYDFEVDGIYYNITSSNTVEVTYDDVNHYVYSSEIIIPETVASDNVIYTVTSIDYSFGQNDNVTSLTIPKTITEFKSSYYAGHFYGGLSNSSLEKICISDLSAWCEIEFYYGRVGAILQYGDQMESTNPLVIAHHLYLNGQEIKELNIPNSVSRIGTAAFIGCSEINSITIPETIKEIGAAAFRGCYSLDRVIISNLDSWLDINFEPFEIWGRCETTVIGLEYSSNPLFYANRLFIDEKEIIDLVIPDAINEIKSAAFINCESFHSVAIPKSVNKIGSYAFANCYNLNKVIISDLEAWLRIEFEHSIDHEVDESLYTIGAYLTCSNPLSLAHHLFINGEEIINLVIPSTINCIKFGTFWGCSSLKTVTIPESVTEIDVAAFYDCFNINTVKSLGSNPPIICTDEYYPDTNLNPWQNEDLVENTYYMFTPFAENVYSSAILYVPINSYDNYKSNVNWSRFTNICNLFQFEVGGINYCAYSDSIAGVSCRDNDDDRYSGTIVIPESVCYDGYTFKITSLFSCCFKNCIYLTGLVLPVSITSIAEDAFDGSGIESVYITGDGEWQGGALPDSVKYLYIGSGVTGVKGMQVDPETIYCYAATPPVCDEQSFMGYDAELHVPAASLAAYFTAPYWCNFTNIVGDAVPVTELSLNQDSVEVLVGSQATLRASVTPANAAPATVEWQSSDTTIATVDNGVITALKRGECDITVICQDKMAVCHVNVTEIVPTGVTLDVEHAKIEVGSQLKLTATVQPDDATDKAVSWSSSNQSVATVDENGMVTAVGQGECNITAWCRGKTATCHVIVVEHLIYIALDQHDASVLPNHILTLTPTITPVLTDLVVTSSNPAVAAARLAGNKIQVVGVTEGTATIYVNSADGYAEADSCRVTVYTEIGDVNCDGFVDITDVTDLIDYLLGSTSGQFSNENADVDHDEKMTINDVTLLIDYLLGSAELQPKDNEGRTFTVNGVSFRMARVDGGTFNMGCTVEQDADADAHEAPVHAVTLSTYLIGQTEVTQELWQAVMGDNPSSFTDDDQCPVERVTWDMCQEFISRLNELTGQIFRLPTEAEWEFAARGGNKSRGYKYAGGNDLAELAWFTDNSSAATHPVGTKKANELGLYDMCGNVNEWCADWYGLYPEEAQTNPSGPESGKSRIYRGGSWQNAAKVCRVTRRNYFAPGAIRNYMGLRLAL